MCGTRCADWSDILQAFQEARKDNWLAEAAESEKEPYSNRRVTSPNSGLFMETSILDIIDSGQDVAYLERI